ncbi:MAG: class I SAM-dependent methyltransferase [Bacteroidota bacterium]
MEEHQIKELAQQLRKPTGELGQKLGEKMNESNRQINESTLARLDLFPNARVLEIGMGNGYFVPQILAAQANVHYTGCDYAEEMITAAIQYNQKAVDDQRATFHLTSAEQLPFEEHHFDRVFAINVLYFWEHPEQVLGEIKRVLKPQGTLTLAIRPKRSMQTYAIAKYGFAMYDKEDLIHLLHENGFQFHLCFEEEEPDQTIEGTTLKIESLIVQATKR